MKNLIAAIVFLWPLLSSAQDTVKTDQAKTDSIIQHVRDSASNKIDSMQSVVDSAKLKIDSIARIKDSIAYLDSVALRSKVLYGTASYYSKKFHGRKTANGEIFSLYKMTCACNRVPLGTWLRVTNLRNGRSIIVKVNDRLHPRMKRIVDLTLAGARKLDFINAGLTKVKVEILGKKPPLGH